MKPCEAVRRLNLLGFAFRLEGEALKIRYQGHEDLDPSMVTPLLEAVKAHKDEVRRLLEGKQPSPIERILSCRECPWYRLNPWTHNPDLGAWCYYHMDRLLIDNPQCIGYRRGEVPGHREHG